jgi:putative transposase
MKQKRFSETEIMQILKQAEQGITVPELCCEHVMSNASFYKWRSTRRAAKQNMAGWMPR